MMNKEKIYTVIRLFLGLAFIVYGLVKLLGIQLAKIHLDENINDIDSVTLVWYFFGYSQVYAKFIGITELLAGVFISFRKTARLGTMMIFSLGLNITVMDYCFKFPDVKYTVTIFTLLALMLLIKDYKFYKRLFFEDEKYQS